MSKHHEMVRGFYQLSRASYAEFCHRPDEILDDFRIGFYDVNGYGSTTGEFCLEWVHVHLNGEFTPKLTVYEDAFDALYRCQDLLEWLASVDSFNPTPEEVRLNLVNMGYKDFTN